jgi:integrase
MPRVSKMQLPLAQWPEEDQRRWDEAFRSGDVFDDNKGGAHLAESTRNALRVSYAQYLRFLSEKHADLLIRLPEVRIDRHLLQEYVARLGRTNGHLSLATSLHHLRLALRLIAPKQDWSWLLTIEKRIAAAAPRKPRKYGLVSSERLYLLGIDLMDKAVAEADEQGEIYKATALLYRDGLMIALLSVIVVRRRTMAAMRAGHQLVRNGDLWALDIPPEDVKGKRALDFALSLDLSSRIDLYLRKFRVRLPGAERHAGLWPSNKRRPMSANAIYLAVCKQTKKAFGYSVNPHRFRHAAGTLWSIQDPGNIRGVKDLLGHASYEMTTEAHYIPGLSRIAGRALANAICAATR